MSTSDKERRVNSALDSTAQRRREHMEKLGKPITHEQARQFSRDAWVKDQKKKGKEGDA